MLDVGTKAPAFTLPGAGGETGLDELLADGPALLAFFKATCPTCQISFPVWGELARRHGDTVRFVAISQSPLPDAVTFLDEYDAPMPALDDIATGFTASAAYDLDTVPTLVLVDRDGSIVHVTQGWDRDAANDWDVRLAALSGREPSPVSTEGDGRPVFKPG